jgi:hypothetical protein
LQEVQQTIQEEIPAEWDQIQQYSGDSPHTTDNGHHTEGPEFDMPAEMVENFVKNSAHIRLIRGDNYNHVPKDLSELLSIHKQIRLMLKYY